MLPLARSWPGFEVDQRWMASNCISSASLVVVEGFRPIAPGFSPWLVGFDQSCPMFFAMRNLRYRFGGFLFGRVLSGVAVAWSIALLCFLFAHVKVVAEPPAGGLFGSFGSQWPARAAIFAIFGALHGWLCWLISAGDWRCCWCPWVPAVGASAWIGRPDANDKVACSTRIAQYRPVKSLSFAYLLSRIALPYRS